MTKKTKKFDFVKVKYNDTEFLVNISSIEGIKYRNCTMWNEGHKLLIYTKTKTDYDVCFKKPEHAMDALLKIEAQMNLLTLTYED